MIRPALGSQIIVILLMYFYRNLGTVLGWRISRLGAVVRLVHRKKQEKIIENSHQPTTRPQTAIVSAHPFHAFFVPIFSSFFLLFAVAQKCIGKIWGLETIIPSLFWAIKIEVGKRKECAQKRTE